MTQQYARGSEWRKWDLHVHTPASAFNNQFTGSSDDEKWEKYFESLEELDDVAVLGLTDYFSIEGYKKVLAYKQSKSENLKNIHLLLPNVELRILPVTGTDTPINLHLIFSPSIVGDLESKFFSNLEFGYADETFKCIYSDLVRLGRKYKNNNSLSSNVAYREGVNQFKVTTENLRKVFSKNPNIRKESLTVISNSNRDGNSGIQHSSLAATRENLYFMADAIFSSNPNDREYFLGQKADSPFEIARKYGALKPCIHGSDAHKNVMIAHPCTLRGDREHDCVKNSTDCKLRYCWIKADTSFEGLRQILYEPELRVKIQEGNPSEAEAYTKIGSTLIILPKDVKIKDESKNETTFCFGGKHEVALSNNLTCIIGGRGTGKSTLGHVIYNASDQDSNLLTKIKSPLINVCLDASPLSSIAMLTDCDVPSNTEFFFQNSLERYASNINEMSKLITHRLINLSAINGTGLNELIEEWKGPRKLIQGIIDAHDKFEELSRIIQTNSKEIETLKTQTEVVLSDEYKKLQKELKELSQELSDLDFYDQTFQKVKEEASKFNKFLAGLKWNDEQGSGFLIEFIKTMEKSIEDLEAKHETYIEKNNKEEIQSRVNTKKDELKEFLNKMGLEDENIEELATANQKIAQLENRNNSIEKEIEPYKEIYELKDEVIGDYKEKYQNYYERYRDVCLSFMLKLKDIEIPNKKIDFDVGASDANMRHVIVQFIKEELSEESGLKADAIEKRIFDTIKAKDYIDDINKLKANILAIEDSGKNTQFLKNLFSQESFVEKVKLRIIKSYYDINNLRVNTKYGGNVLRNTSFGERCGIVITMVLSAGTNPIVIDQPEDHLDGRFISEILVPLIRKQKSNRQIILITRDANIVIGSDAELINILEVKDLLTTISPATIENLTQRENYIWVLDGGKDAFLKRENKYNLKAGD